MSKRKYIWVIIIVVSFIALLIIGKNVFVKKEAAPAQKTLTELEWLLTGEYEDTTEQHMRNLAENYQILEDYILYLEEDKYFEKNILYKVDKKENTKTKLLENVGCFWQQGNELYYSSFKDSYNELGVYNMLTGETKMILGKKARMEQILFADSQYIFYLNYDECIMKCKWDGTEKKKHMNYSTTAQPFAVVKGADTLFFNESGTVTSVSLKDKTVNKKIAVDYLSDNVMVCSENKVYIAIEAYTMKGYENVSVKSKWNGLWEIDMMKPYNMRKISDKVPKKLYWRNGMLYNEHFDKIPVLSSCEGQAVYQFGKVMSEEEICINNSYKISYDEYKEEKWKNFKIFIPKVKGIGNQDLEAAINRELKKEAVTWLKNDIYFSNGHQPKKPKVWCQTNRILSIELPYETDGRRISYVDHFINIDIVSGKKLSFKTLITNQEKLITLLRDGKTLCSYGPIYDLDQKESDSYLRKRMKEMSDGDLNRILEQCTLPQEDFALYDEGTGNAAVGNRANFLVTKDALVITFVEHGYRYYAALELERLKKEGIINNQYF